MLSLNCIYLHRYWVWSIGVANKNARFAVLVALMRCPEAKGKAGKVFAIFAALDKSEQGRSLCATYCKFFVLYSHVLYAPAKFMSTISLWKAHHHVLVHMPDRIATCCLYLPISYHHNITSVM